jgi:hypothetical protein
MNEGSWFSARIRLVCLIEGTGATDYMDSVVTFRANGFDDAFHRALELGRREEREYLNRERERVVWRLKEITSLDEIPSQTLDGTEVHCEISEVPESDVVPFDSKFFPERSHPEQTVVRPPSEST